jgi:hypothetical protein
MDFRNDRYYCLVCPLCPEQDEGRFVTAAGVRIHLQNPAHKGGHGIASPQHGQHYVGGYRARQVYAKRVAQADREGDLLGAFLTSIPNYTGEDFLTDFKDRREVA